VALERLLGGPCYHMVEVFGRPGDVPVWRDAMAGRDVDWHALFAGYEAVVDWPAAGVWDRIADAFPDAPVLLSTRTSADEWWRSASNTIFHVDPGTEMAEWKAMTDEMFRRFADGDHLDEATAKAAYERHNAAVRATVPPERLVEWQPADGWAPLCRALEVPVPDEPFPVTNTTPEFRQMVGLDPL
jgi:hypothetical protein